MIPPLARRWRWYPGERSLSNETSLLAAPRTSSTSGTMGAGFSSDDEYEYQRTRRYQGAYHQTQIPPVHTKNPAHPGYLQPPTTSQTPSNVMASTQATAVGTRVLYTTPAVAAGAPNVSPMQPGVALSVGGDPQPSQSTSHTNSGVTSTNPVPGPGAQQMMMYYVKTPGYAAPLAIPIPVGQAGPIHVRIEQPRREPSLLDPFFWGFDSDSDDEYYTTRRQQHRATKSTRAPAPPQPTDTVSSETPEPAPSVKQADAANVIENYILPEEESKTSGNPQQTLAPQQVPSQPEPVLEPLPDIRAYSIKERDEEPPAQVSKTLKFKAAKPPSEFELHEAL